MVYALKFQQKPASLLSTRNLKILVFFQTFNDDVINHSKDVDGAKEAGKDLADAQESIKGDVQKVIGK